MTEPLLSVVALGIILLALVFAPLRTTLSKLFARLDRLSARTQATVAIAIALAVSAYLPLTAMRQGRSLDPQIQDSLSYAVMARMYASGHLWMPAHPLAESLDSFYIFVTPVYGSMYFPGTGFFYAIPVLLRLPLWVMSSALSGVFVGLAFWIIARVRCVSAGVATALVLVGTSHFRWFSLQVLSHVPMMVLVAACYIAYLCWRSQRAWRWLVVLSLTAGMALITRPYDALLLLIPVALAVLIDSARQSVGRAAACIAISLACTLPFITLQMVVNHAFTGSVWKTPFAEYFDKDMPNAGFGFHEFDKGVRPANALVQKQVFYDDYVRKAMLDHTPSDVISIRFWGSRLIQWFTGTTQVALLVLPMVIGLALSFRTPLWPIAIAPVTMVIGYVPYPFFQSWYASGALIGFWVCVWLGVSSIERILRLKRDELRVSVVTAASMVAIAGLPEFYRKPLDTIIFHSPEQLEINWLVDTQVQAPALVFIRYDNTEAYRSQHEPVYNYQTAWPDDAPVVRVHSLQPEADRRVLEYYQKLGPARRVYLIDRANMQLQDLGLIDEALARRRDVQPSTRDRR